MPLFIANADYEEKDRKPIKLIEGDEVLVGLADKAWPGWVWATDAHGKDGYIPEGILKSLGEGRFQVVENFNPHVLCIKRGDQLESLKQVHGWHWCKNLRGEEGWVGGYLLKPV
jgi:Variant SH3 domain